MTDDAWKLAGQLIKNGIHFRYMRYAGKTDKPMAVSLEVTHHCIAKCVMCNIWQIPRDIPNLTTEDWLHLLSSNLFSELKELDITGGEPFLRKDLPDLIAGICALKNLNHLRSIAITSNGFLTRRVLEHVEKILQTLETKSIDLVMVCAMDAIGPTHDKIRHFKAAWSKVNKTLQSLKILRERYANLIIGLKTTVLPINVGELPKIVQYANANGFFTIISPCIITAGRYLNPEKAEELVFSPEAIEQMVQFYQAETTGWSYHGEQLVRLLQTGRINKPCTCGFNYFFVRSNGDLMLCPLIDNCAGNIKETPVEALFYSKKAAAIRRHIGRYAECHQCTEPGLERYSLPYEGWAYLALLLKIGKKAFFEHHRHMGLDKYFDATM